jgi:general secretion pathway protein D
MRIPIVRALALLLALAPLAGCTSHLAYRQAETAAQRGDWDKAVLQYMKALEDDPENITFRAALMRAKIKASQTHFEKGQEFEKAGVVERALVEYQQAAQLDPTNQYAKARLEHVHQNFLAQRQNRSAGTIEQLKAKAKSERPQPPVLNPRSNQPISLEFPEPVSVFQIYRALGKAFGINILFDPNLKDQEISIDLKDVTAQTALETLMRAVNHFYKVLDDHTVLIAADTPQNRRTYEDLVIQTFFLSNAEVKDMMTILRSLVDAKKIATNEQLNAIILRDTADRVKVAEKIIETNDKSKAEVVIDVELLQINSGRLRDLGVDLSQRIEPPARLRAAVPEPGRLDPQPAQLHLQLRQDQHRRPAPGQAAAPHHRGREGQPGDRRPRADPAHHLQHPERRRQRRHRPHHLVPVPGRRHPHRARAARAP